MNKLRDYLCFGVAAMGIFLIVVMTLRRCGEEKAQPLSRAIDTVYTGVTDNDGTGMTIKEAMLILNIPIKMLDSLGIDDLTAQDFTNLANLMDSLAAIRGDISSVAGFNVDSISQLATEYYAVYVGADTLPPHVPDAYTDDPYDIFPEIHAFAGDTSNYNTPDKIGDLFINTATSKVYVSVSTSRGGWVILNMILPLLLIVRRRRRK